MRALPLGTLWIANVGGCATLAVTTGSSVFEARGYIALAWIDPTVSLSFAAAKNHELRTP